jgi:DNA repair protein SbcC/Rad50
MIPVRVLLRNFLCYDETDEGAAIEFDFEGSRLWSISGDNGAGKSAIFDAITYALFGQHRGGAQEDARLIRKGARECEAAFEFRLDERVYRVRRTVGRRRGKARQEPKTWQAAWFDPGVGDWRPIPETERETGLKRWVQQQLGFGYETFVASVLLLQGQSDQLILAPPKRRFDILSGLLELEPYKRLEAAASDGMRAARAQAQSLEGQLAGLPEVAAGEIEQAQAAAREREEALERAQAAAAQAEVLVNEARRYALLQKELSETEDALVQTETLLNNAHRIRSEYQEWQRLSEAVPKLRAGLVDLQEADSQAAQAEEARTTAAAVDAAALERAAAEAAAEERQTEERARELRRERDALAGALPPLREVLHRRGDLAEREQVVAEQGAPDEWEAQVARREEVLRTQREEKQEADEAQRRAMEAVAQAEAALQQAEEQLAARREAQDEAVCSRCGQPVDPEHIRRELEDAERAVAATHRQVESAEQARAVADREAAAVAAGVDDANREVEAARHELAASQRAEEERQRACAQLDSAIEAAARAPADLRAAVAEAPLSDAEATVSRLDGQIKELSAQVQRAEEAERQTRQRARRAQEAHQQALHGIQRLEGEAQRLDECARGLRRQAEVRLGDVDREWRERALAQDEAFVQALSARCSALEGVEEQHAALERAVAERGQLGTRVQEIQRGLQSVRPEHRVPVQEAETSREEAQSQLKESQERRDEAREALRRLQETQERRHQLEAESAAAHRRRVLYARLVELLGRSGLQAFLMDAAIQGISHLANETLARTSGGQLQLQILRQASTRGEEEIAIQATDLASSDEPLDVQFISGSQKFRTSVALAAGIGQYAGRGAGSVRSLIIDEGFGSLDTQGRQEMIDELRNLSQLMDRIIVVSHQEDFQDRTLFPTGYVLRKVGQRTEVERFV